MGALRARVPDELGGERADLIVARLANVSRAVARRLVAEGAARFDDRAAAPAERFAAGTQLDVELAPEERRVVAEPVPFDVAYDDDWVAVVAKPAGVVVHPGAGARAGTLVAGLLDRWPELEGVGEAGRWGLVHRLDKETSGALAVAKTPEVLEFLRSELKARRVQRSYRALVGGSFAIPTGTIDAPLGRDPHHPTRVAVQRGGRPARTHYRRLAEWAAADAALVQVRLDTGRTHQIRVHLASIGHPVVGDGRYGTRRTPPLDPGRVWLHASVLGFRHPHRTGLVRVCVPYPPDLEASLHALGAPTVGAATPISAEDAATGG